MKDQDEYEYGKRIDELPPQPSEIVEYPEAKTYDEVAKEPDEVKEYSEAVTNSSPSEVKLKRKSSKTRQILKTAAGLVSVVAVVTIIAPDLFSSDDTIVSFGDISATDTEIVYEISLENMSDDTYTAVLYNNFTEREKVIEGGSLQWTESSLKPDMKYTLAVKNGSKVIAEKEVKTIKTEDMKVTEWYSDLFVVDDYETSAFDGTYGCTCGTNGNFRFIMQFIDENGWWSDFEATLTDGSGNVSTCTFTEDLHAMQTIPVTGVLDGESATFRITCVSTENAESGETITLFEDEVEI